MGGEDKSKETIIIDDVLCYIQNKMKILGLDPIISLCEPVFGPEKIENAKQNLFELCYEENDKTERKTRIGQHKNASNIRDIYNLLHEKGESAPVFVARDLNTLPPVTINSLDISVLLTENKTLRAEVAVMKKTMEEQTQVHKDMFEMMKTLAARVDKLDGSAELSAPNVGIGSPESQREHHTQPKPNVGPIGLNHNAPPFEIPNMSAPKRTFASLLATNNSHGNGFVMDNDGFMMVGPNGKPIRNVHPVFNPMHVQNVKKTKKSAIGTSARNNIVAATRLLKANVFATRYKPDTTVDHVKDDLKEDERLKDLDISVEKVTTKYNNYASFHVTCVCTEEQSKLFLEPDIWPPGILFRPWEEKKNNRNQGSGVRSDFYNFPPRWPYYR